jgi:ubiquinone/menaquinone biosynthesis C-methylase UbiE
VDPTLHFKQFWDENKSKFPDITLEKYIISSAENLRGVVSNSCDIVVTTGVLCSVDNVRNVLREIRRVLVPVNKQDFIYICFFIFDLKI